MERNRELERVKGELERAKVSYLHNWHNWRHCANVFAMVSWWVQCCLCAPLPTVLMA